MKEDSKNKEKLSATNAAKLGLTTGAIEVTVNLGLWNWKTRAQCGLPFTLDPRILYRGWQGAFASMSIITGLQISASAHLERSTIKDIKVTEIQRIFSAFCGGYLSAILFGPLDLIGVQHQKHDYKTYYLALTNTIKKVGYKGLWTGTPATGVTDGLITMGFYGLYPAIKRRLNQN